MKESYFLRQKIMDSCHNCGSTELYSTEVKGYLPEQLIPVGGFYLFKQPKFIVIVCGNCQSIHLFAHQDSMDKIRNEYGDFQRYYGNKDSEES
jgi:predicted nucleic-acid-binding Zn-ribbon protein